MILTFGIGRENRPTRKAAVGTAPSQASSASSSSSFQASSSKYSVEKVLHLTRISSSTIVVEDYFTRSNRLVCVVVLDKIWPYLDRLIAA